jgi:hypothetical protein
MVVDLISSKRLMLVSAMTVICIVFEICNFEYISDLAENIISNINEAHIPSREVMESNQMLSGMAINKIKKNEPFIFVCLNSVRARIANKTTKRVTKLLNIAAV